MKLLEIWAKDFHEKWVTSLFVHSEVHLKDSLNDPLNFY